VVGEAAQVWGFWDLELKLLVKLAGVLLIAIVVILAVMAMLPKM
jgi:hypothetical protein